MFLIVYGLEERTSLNEFSHFSEFFMLAEHVKYALSCGHDRLFVENIAFTVAHCGLVIDVTDVKWT